MHESELKNEIELVEFTNEERKVYDYNAFPYFAIYPNKYKWVLDTLKRTKPDYVSN